MGFGLCRLCQWRLIKPSFSVSHHQWRLGRAKWRSRASRNLVHPGCCWLPPPTFVPRPRERYQTVWTGHAPARGHFLAPLSASIEATVCLGLHKVSVRENGGFVCIELTRSDIDGGCEYDECRCSTEPLSPLCVCLNVAMKLRSLRFRLPRLCRIAVLKSNQRSERRSPSQDWENLSKSAHSRVHMYMYRASRSADCNWRTRHISAPVLDPLRA